MSAYGAKHIVTPHIDRIAKEGVLFQHAYCTTPVCGPSRAGIMTGRCNQRFGYETQEMQFYPTNFIEYVSGRYFSNTGSFKVKSKPVYPREWQIHKQGVPPTEIIFTELFKKYDYQTGYIGKWHLGHDRKHLPENRGCDYSYGFLGHSSLYTPEQGTPGYISYVPDDFAIQHQWKTKRNDEAAIRENGKEIIEEQYLTYAIRDKGIAWMKKQKDKPFLAVFAFNAPHEPFQAPVEYYCKWGNDLQGNELDENHQIFYAMVNALDDAVGAVHQAIKDMGIEDNTIIWFLSDNGGASYTGATDNGPLKGGKLTYFEGGVSVPMMIKWKGVLPEGMVYDKAVSTTDVFVTSALNCGMTLPDDRVYDGKNIIPFLTGQMNDEEPHPVIYYRAAHVSAMRYKNWKFVMSTRDNYIEFYNLDSDGSEMHNIYEENKHIYDEMYQMHLKWQQELPKKPMWPHIMDKEFHLEDGKTYYFPA